MNRSRTLVSGFAWSYGAQLATIVIQLAYAAVTSRAVGARGFGDYGIALASTALIVLLANGGMNQTVARMRDLQPSRLISLAGYATALGLVASAILFVSAELWAAVWGSPDAAEPIRWLCVSSALSPLTSLTTGLLRRQGRFRRLAVITFVANVVAMIIGAVFVEQFKSASSLVVSPILSLSIICLASLLSSIRSYSGRPRFLAIQADIAFSWKLSGSSLLSYVNLNVGRLSVSRALGVGALGQWNRAEVISTVPLSQLQGVLTQVLYPEFRHDIGGNRRTATVWTDMQILVAWGVLPIAAVWAQIAPTLVPYLFGPGWEVAASLVGFLIIAAALRIVAGTLAGALEALAKFRLVVVGLVAQLVVYLAGALATFQSQSWTPVIVSMFIAVFVQHALYVTYCARRGLLQSRRLVRGYFGAFLAAVIVWSFWPPVEALVGLAPDVGWVSVPLYLLGVLVMLGIGWLARRSLPPFEIALRYFRNGRRR